jgi:hypothetical protein
MSKNSGRKKTSSSRTAPLDPVEKTVSEINRVFADLYRKNRDPSLVLDRDVLIAKTRSKELSVLDVEKILHTPEKFKKYLDATRDVRNTLSESNAIHLLTTIEKNTSLPVVVTISIFVGVALAVASPFVAVLEKPYTDNLDNMLHNNANEITKTPTQFALSNLANSSLNVTINNTTANNYCFNDKKPFYPNVSRTHIRAKNFHRCVR